MHSDDIKNVCYQTPITLINSLSSFKNCATNLVNVSGSSWLDNRYNFVYYHTQAIP